MTQKYAIVPVDMPAGELDGGEQVTYGWIFEKEGIGKITRQQVEVMVKIAYNENGLFPFGWEATSENHKTICIRSMVAALNAIGLSVEE